MPYQVNKARALEGILKITQEKKAMFAGVSDIRDESDRMGMRAVIEVKRMRTRKRYCNTFINIPTFR